MAVNIIYRMPNLKEIRPLQFGKTISLIITLIAIGFYYDFLFNSANNLIFIPIWLLIGFLFGIIMAYLYNMFLSWSVKLVFRVRKEKNVLFGYEPGQIMQTIKSPIQIEEVNLEVEFMDRRIYNNKINPVPVHPYTIAFIASPYYMGYDQADNPVPIKDPILDDERFFYTSVGRALIPLANDEVLGHPDIWSRIRIITIFFNPPAGHNPVDFTFVGESSFVYGEQLIDGADDIISPNSPLDIFIRNNQQIPNPRISSFKNDLAAKFNLSNQQQQIFNDVDVIFFMTANEQYFRSSARPSEGELIGNPSESFFNNYQINNPFQIKYNEKFSLIPGMIALNVLYARQKTYIHEFAHAMAHEKNGAICDEYYDTEDASDIFTINAIRKSNQDIHIPKEFMEYQPQGRDIVQYYSDRDHPSSLENWRQFFPLRESKHIGCIMDRTIGEYQFDKLLSAFMYDRLITKVTR